MKKLAIRIAAPILVAMSLAHAATAAFAQRDDPGILVTALGKQLGERTNTGAPRVARIKKETKGGANTLIISLNANNNPTSAGLRNGVYTDIVKVFKILKSWGWPERVDSVIIGEYYSPAARRPASSLANLIFVGGIASNKISETDWDSFDARRLPEIMDSAELYEPIK